MQAKCARVCFVSQCAARPTTGKDPFKGLNERPTQLALAGGCAARLSHDVVTILSGEAKLNHSSKITGPIFLKHPMHKDLTTLDNALIPVEGRKALIRCRGAEKTLCLPLTRNLVGSVY